jgi:hypothetical protein
MYRAIDVYPDICDVIVKTFCMLHNFVRQRNGFQFQDTLYECSLESIKAVGTRGTDMGGGLRGRASLRGGPVGKPGSELVYRGFMCGRSLWKLAPLSIGCQLGCGGGGGVR